MAAFWRGKKSSSRSITAISKSEQKIGGCVGAIFFFVFLMAGLFFGYMVVLKPLVMTIKARSWVETPCKILSGQVESHSDSDGTTYSIEFEYEYTYRGVRYTSDQYDLMDVSSSGHDGKKRVVDEYLRMESPVCFVNPYQPQEAVLKRGLSWIMVFGLLPLVFVVVGGGGIYGSIWGFRRRRKKVTKSDWLPGKEKSGDSLMKSYDYGFGRSGSESVVLKSKGTPLGKLACAIGATIFWNGITSVFVTIAIRSHLKGDPEWFLTFFIIPFVLIGL